MMKRFMLKCTLIALVLFLGVLLGFQQANSGMWKMKGYKESPTTGQDFHILQKEDSFVRNELTRQDIKEKQEKLEQIKSNNVYSSIGKKLADSVTNAVGKVLHDSVEKVKEL